MFLSINTLLKNFDRKYTEVYGDVPHNAPYLVPNDQHQKLAYKKKSLSIDEKRKRLSSLWKKRLQNHKNEQEKDADMIKYTKKVATQKSSDKVKKSLKKILKNTGKGLSKGTIKSTISNLIKGSVTKNLLDEVGNAPIYTKDLKDKNKHFKSFSNALKQSGKEGLTGAVKSLRPVKAYEAVQKVRGKTKPKDTISKTLSQTYKRLSSETGKGALEKNKKLKRKLQGALGVHGMLNTYSGIKKGKKAYDSFKKALQSEKTFDKLKHSLSGIGNSIGSVHKTRSGLSKLKTLQKVSKDQTMEKKAFTPRITTAWNKVVPKTKQTWRSTLKPGLQDVGHKLKLFGKHRLLGQSVDPMKYNLQMADKEYRTQYVDEQEKGLQATSPWATNPMLWGGIGGVTGAALGRLGSHLKNRSKMNKLDASGRSLQNTYTTLSKQPLYTEKYRSKAESAVGKPPKLFGGKEYQKNVERKAKELATADKNKTLQNVGKNQQIVNKQKNKLHGRTLGASLLGGATLGAGLYGVASKLKKNKDKKIRQNLMNYANVNEQDMKKYKEQMKKRNKIKSMYN